MNLRNRKKPRTHKSTLRLNDEEKARSQLVAEVLGMDPAVVHREAVMILFDQLSAGIDIKEKFSSEAA